MNIDNIITAAIYIVVFFLLFYIGKVVNHLLHRQYDLVKELVEKDNPALALAVTGYYFGLVIAIGGSIAGPSNGLIEDVLDLCIYGVLSIIMLNASWYICDKLMLYKFNVIDELLRDHNQGTGVVFFGVIVASGIVIFGAVSGEGGTIWTAIAFWVIGQIMLLIAGFVYNRITSYDIHDEIEKDNAAAGVSFAGALIAIGIVIGRAAEGDFSSWQEDLPPFLLITLSGFVLLPIIRFLTDKILLPTVKLTDEIANQETPNIGAAYIEAFSYIAAAFIINWCV